MKGREAKEKKKRFLIRERGDETRQTDIFKEVGRRGRREGTTIPRDVRSHADANASEPQPPTV